MDYLKHFNLSDRPFKNTYDGRFFFRSQAAEAVFAALRDQSCPSLVHLKGPDKVGKTSILRRLAPELRDSFKVIVWLNPHLNLAEMLRQALNDLGHSHKFTPHTPEEELLGYFQNTVSEALADGYRLLLAVDNADELSPEFLSELYGLMELESSWLGRVLLLLCGSPDQPWPMVPDMMTEVRELSLPPLDAGEAEEYVLSRLKAAGGAACFSRGALRDLWEYGRGRPETINQLAERGLIAAWSAGRREVGPSQLKAARTSLDNPLTLNRQALNQAARGPAPVRPHQPPPRPAASAWVFRPLAILLVLVLAGVFFIQSRPSQPEAGPLVVPESEPLMLTDQETEANQEALTPAGDNQVVEAAGVLAPTSNILPPQVLSLPQGSMALVVNMDESFGQLWQGGARGPGKKGELATPKFKHKGLYLFGRPRSDNPLIFQYPPARDVPLAEARELWPRVATLLPQNILPVIVAPGLDYAKSRNTEAEEAVAKRVKAWVQSQQYRFADTTAALYASSFQFFELGRAPRTVKREDFRRALNSEVLTSGEVDLTTSQPLIMQDPGQPDLVWAVFNLKYDSKLRHDMGLRVLIFEKGGLLSQDSWLIVAELWLPEKSLREN